MAKAKIQQRVSRAAVGTQGRSAGNSPLPSGPIHAADCGPCGHSGCATACRVRYVGPTSHSREHQIITAARGVTHVWPAAIAAGLAVVLTGAIAYTAVEAHTEAVKNSDLSRVERELSKMNTRMNALEQRLIPR